VTAADIVDANRTGLPHLVFDGASLPLPDRSVDIALLVFVLHHARDPDGLLRDAARVARTVVVVETTPEESRRRRIEATDRLANRLRPMSLRDEERWLRMRPAAEWRRRIAGAGLEVITERSRGGLLHPQTLFVTRPAPGLSTRTRDDVAAR
jgi:hypothetical protein